VLTAASGHVVYPLWLWLRTHDTRTADPPEGTDWPDVTVVVPAYLESRVVAEKVLDTLANGYPGALEVLVVADDHETAEAARSTPARVLSFDGRLGKAEAINRAAAECNSQVLVLTDANTKLAPGAIGRLVRWFADPSVWAVAGEKAVLDGGGEALYWRFESWLKQRESQTGTTIGLVGELAALRRDRLRPLPKDLIIDDLWLALDIAEEGGRVVYEPAARAEELPSPSTRLEWQRRTRNVAGLLDVLWRRRRLLVPGASPVTPQLWGHRLVRSSIGPMAHIGLLVYALRSATRSRTARVLAASHLLGGVALVRMLRGTARSRPERAAAQVLYLQGVALAGTVRYLTGDRPTLWEKTER
jgi:cellulose synthase/poly-beta-1,6-N-acetylglucosamine synthase-like glycosyltransferase